MRRQPQWNRLLIVLGRDLRHNAQPPEGVLPPVFPIHQREVALIQDDLRIVTSDIHGSTVAAISELEKLRRTQCGYAEL